MNRKTLAVFLILMILFVNISIVDKNKINCFITQNANAESEISDNFTYTIINNRIRIIAYLGSEAEVVIPSVIENKQVTDIASYAFADNENLISVTIPRCLKVIENMAIGYYYDLEESKYLKIPDLKIKCFSDTEGKKYAIDNNFKYELLDFAKPAVVTGFKAESTTNNTINLTWDNVFDAHGYIIYNYDTVNRKWVRAVKTASTSNLYKLSKLKAGTTYKLAIKAYKTVNGKELTNECYPILLAATNPATVTGFKVSSSAASAIKLTWNRVAGAKGYIIYQMKSGKWVRIAKTVTPDTSYIVRNLNKGTEYRYAIKAYKNVNNKEITSIKFPTVTAYTKIKTVSGFKVSGVSISAVKLTWNRVEGAQGYIVYKYDNVTNKWIRTAKTTTTANTYVVNKLSADTTYSFAVKAYITINGKEVTSETYPTVSAKTKQPILKIEVKNGVTYINNVLIVNKTYVLPSTYNPGGLTKETYCAFLEMQKCAAKDNINLWITSGFRSYSYQNYLYNSYVARDGRAAADRYSARAGHSEHQTGLAIDLNNASSYFNNSKEADWIEKHCAEYGFILRYPEGKESKTGYQYESWHVRYVGKDLAKKIMNSGLCLEEYFGITSKYK